jgi:hypothetical protein
MKIIVRSQSLIKESAKTLAAFNQPSGDIGTLMPPRGVLKALRAFMRDGKMLHPKAYANHMESYSGGGVNSALMDVVAYFDDMNLVDKADALRGALSKVDALKHAGDLDGFHKAMQELTDSLEMELSGQDVSNDPKADEVNHMMENREKMGKTRGATIGRSDFIRIASEEIFGAFRR